MPFVDSVLAYRSLATKSLVMATPVKISEIIIAPKHAKTTPDTGAAAGQVPRATQGMQPFFNQGFQPIAVKQPMNQFTDPNNTAVFVGGQHRCGYAGVHQAGRQAFATPACSFPVRGSSSVGSADDTEEPHRGP